MSAPANQGETIYVVTSGSYSDYSIVGVFTDKALADKVAEMCGDAEVESHEANPNADALNVGLQPWTVRLDRNGDGGAEAYMDHVVERSREATYRITSKDVRYASIEVQCWARNKAHAIKIAGELRARSIAANEWPTTEIVWREEDAARLRERFSVSSCAVTVPWSSDGGEE